MNKIITFMALLATVSLQMPTITSSRIMQSV